jgi:hypothetical protein
MAIDSITTTNLSDTRSGVIRFSMRRGVFHYAA